MLRATCCLLLAPAALAFSSPPALNPLQRPARARAGTVVGAAATTLKVALAANTLAEVLNGIAYLTPLRTEVLKSLFGVDVAPKDVLERSSPSAGSTRGRWRLSASSRASGFAVRRRRCLAWSYCMRSSVRCPCGAWYQASEQAGPLRPTSSSVLAAARRSVPLCSVSSPSPRSFEILSNEILSNLVPRASVYSSRADRTGYTSNENNRTSECLCETDVCCLAVRHPAGHPRHTAARIEHPPGNVQ